MQKSLTFAGVLSALLLLTAQLPATTAIGEEQILNFLEEFRQRMCHPIPKWNLPALDPFEIEYTAVAVDNDYLIDFSASLENFKLTGLSDFKVNELVIAPVGDSIINITLPLTAFKSLYTAKGSLAWVLMLAGEGDAEGMVEMVTLAASFRLKPAGQLSISNLRINITIAKLFVYFENLFEEPRINDFMHALINELGVELLHDIWEAEHDVVEARLEKKLNGILGQYTLAQITESVGGEPAFGPNDPPADCKKQPLVGGRQELLRRLQALVKAAKIAH